MRFGFGMGLGRRGAAAVLGPGPNAAQLLVADLGGDAVVPGIYWTKSGVRVNATPVVQVWDDARCSTDSGRFHFPGAANEHINLGNLVNLDAATRLTVMMWVTVGDVSTSRRLFARFGGANSGQIDIRMADPRVRVLFNDANVIATGAAVLAVGNTYKITVVFDGTLVGDANRLKVYIATRQADGSYGADAADVMTMTSGNIPAALITAAAATDASIGGASTPFFGFMDEVRVWIGTALSAGQVAAETLAVNPVAAGLRYTFADGIAENTGSIAGFDGTVSANVIACSDDLAYGPPLACLANELDERPAWDAANLEVEFDGVDDFLRGVGGKLSGIDGAMALAHIGDIPAVGAADRHIATVFQDATFAVLGCFRTTAANGNWLRISTGGGSANITNAPPAGIRAFHARRPLWAAGTIGVKGRFGSGAEAGPDVGIDSQNRTASMLGIGGWVDGSTPAPLVVKGVVLYDGADYTSANKYALVNAFAAAELGATI